MDKEKTLIQREMTITSSEEVMGSVYHCGFIGDQQVVLVQCGVGKINTAIATYILISQYKAAALINVGVAGAIDPRLRVLDVVIGNQILFHDYDHSMYSRYQPFETIFNADPELVEACQRAAKTVVHPDHLFIGRIITGDEFIESSSHKQALVQQFSPLCVEMEGAALAQVAYVAKVPFVVIRTMSDSADNHAQATFDSLSDQAAEVSAQIVLTVIGGV